MIHRMARKILSHIYEDDPVMRRTRHYQNFGAGLSDIFSHGKAMC
jgi:hypothetical protein